jgi:hypothetical protein
MYNDLHSYIPCSIQGASLFAGNDKSYKLLRIFIGDIFKVFTTTTTTTTRERFAGHLCLQSFINLSILPYIVSSVAVLFRSYSDRFHGSDWKWSETLSNSLIINHQTEEHLSKLNYVPA